MIITKAKQSDLKAINEFYEKCGLLGEANKNEYILIAKNQNAIIGAIRLSNENNIYILKGLQIAENYQNQGIGVRLLNSIKEKIVNKDCFSLIFAEHQKFYNDIGFYKINKSESPAFLIERYELLKNKYKSLIIVKQQKHSV